MLLIAFFGIPMIVTVVALIADLRTRRGYGLAVAALAASIACAWLLVRLLGESLTAINNAGFDYVLGLGLFFLGETYLAGIVLLAALIEAGTARQWRWLGGMLASFLLPGVFLAITFEFTFSYYESFPRILTLNAVPLMPLLACLAYGVARSWHAAQPARSRRSVPVG